MINNTQRRYSRWYELILLNNIFLFILGILVVVGLPAYWQWGISAFKQPIPDFTLNTLLANIIAFTASFIILRKLKTFPGTRSLPFIIPTVSITWLAVFTLILFLREIDYSRPVLIYSFGMAMLWSFIGHFLAKRFKRPKLAIVPFGRALEIQNIEYAIVKTLKSPNLENQRFDGVVADFHAKNLPSEWQSFLASCALAHIPVFHSQQIIESLTGRVKVDHLSENVFGELLPSFMYLAVKRLIDTVAAILLLPFILPIMIITAVLIKLDSKGSVFYNQQRMGYRGKSFKMYKFRSMRNDIEGKGYTDGEEDPRITRVGKVIRKFRIDELPQIINVIKGDMSWIGPRPESLQLSKWYEKDVPFFSYRHIVRPGISGWAQVNQGYAAEVEGMTEKLQYDFYYIKNFSLWLDILIVVKTIRTILTGFGAR